MSRKYCCKNHSKYSPGCKDCIDVAKLARRIERNDETHYKNGVLRRQGIYSEDNWAKFNALGRALINNKKRDKI